VDKSIGGQIEKIPHVKVPDSSEVVNFAIGNMNDVGYETGGNYCQQQSESKDRGKSSGQFREIKQTHTQDGKRE